MLNSIPRMESINGHTVFMVDDKPFLLLGLQLNCDSCYNARDIDFLFRNAHEMGCNTVCPLLYWNLIEPEKDRFDYSILQAMLDAANRYDLRIQLDWFGSYKNGCMAYAPEWIKDDHKTYRRVIRRDGSEVPNVACYNCKETLERDINAVCHVFQYLRDNDATRRVIVFQVNNETGIMGDERCHCDTCNRLYEAGGYAAKYGVRAEDTFSAFSNLAFQEAIAEKAKAIYPLPCYMNAMLSHDWKPSIPGTTYCAGGPDFKNLDVYLENKKWIDIVSPDIYTPSVREFARVCRQYSRENNQLFIPECSTGNVSRSWKNVIYAIGQWGAMGYDPWAIDCCFANESPRLFDPPLCDRITGRWSDEAYKLKESYLLTRSIQRPLTEKMGTKDVGYWVQEEGDNMGFWRFDDGINVSVKYMDPSDGCSRGYIVRLSKTEFLVAGVGAMVGFYTDESAPIHLLASDFGVWDEDHFVVMGQHTMGQGASGRYALFQKDAMASYARLDL